MTDTPIDTREAHAEPHPCLTHTEVDGEHRFAIPGLVEARTRNWGIARTFAEVLVRIAAGEG